MKLFRELRVRRAAGREYWALERRLGATHRALGRESNPAARWSLLYRMAGNQIDQARVHDAAFGRDVLPGDAAGDMAQSMRWAATLYQLLADVEQAVAYPHLGRRVRMAAVLGEESDRILDDMAALPVLADRMALLGELWEAVHVRVGGQAAEVVWCLPWPDMPADDIAARIRAEG